MIEEMEEEEIEQIIKGDKESFTQLVLRYKMLLYKIALTRLNDEEDINEAIQETMLAVYKDISRLKSITKLKAWMIKILINKCNAIYRKNKFKVISMKEIENNLLQDDSNKVEEKMDLERILKKLKSEDQQIILLYYYEGYSVKQVSEILAMNENTVKTRLRRSLSKLKEEYQSEESEVDGRV